MGNYYCLQGNRDDSDVLMYYTTTGWMMWNWMVSALALGKALNGRSYVQTNRLSGRFEPISVYVGRALELIKIS